MGNLGSLSSAANVIPGLIFGLSEARGCRADEESEFVMGEGSVPEFGG